MKNKYDVVIVGGGPAGVAAGIYCARKMLNSLLITDNIGGQSIVSNKIENWIGEPEISGYDLAKKLENHIKKFSGMIDLSLGNFAEKIERNENDELYKFKVIVKDKNEYLSKSVIICSGGRRRKLNVSGEKEFEGKGVFYCATCDAPLMKDKKAVVVGGGNAGLEAVLELSLYASEIYIIERGSKLKGDPITQSKVINNKKLKKVFYNSSVKEIKGDKFVRDIIINSNGEDIDLKIDGVFVEIGSVPNSEIIDFVDKNKRGEIMIDSKYGSTSCEGVFAAGDVTDDPYKQNNIAVGDAIKCALSAFNYLNNINK